MTLLANLEDLVNRLDFELDERETALAESALEDASDLARHYGNAAWGEGPLGTPPYVRVLVLRAAKRFMDNPQGYTTSRAGDETLQWHDADEGMGEVHFTVREQNELGRLAGKTKAAFGTIPIVAWGSKIRRGPGYVPVQGGERPFPMFTSDEVGDDW